jgi:hypothetical protein
MKHMLRGVALSTFCLVASGCGGEPEYRFKPLPIPTERMDCVAIDKTARPALVPVYKIDWTKVANVPQAIVEVAKLMQSVNQRELIVSNYVVELEDKLFLCSSDAIWLREYTSKVEN